MLIEKESITSQKLGSRHFWKISNSNLNKGKSAIPPLHEVLSHSSDKAEVLKIFLRTQIFFFFQLGFTTCKAEQPLRIKELQEKEEEKDEENIGKLLRKIP